MMVIFVSQCEKNALKKTRRVLDAFANRVGDNTWQTVITEEGLHTVKKMLRQTASKSTAVSCHWIRSRARSQLLWVVGKKDKFNAQGYVPVNTTRKNLLTSDSENDWQYLPLIKALVAVAALLHDWGKATKLFQDKLNPKKKVFKGDPIRHEWISLLLLHALVSLTKSKSDADWLTCFSQGEINEEQLKSKIQQPPRHPFAELPPMAKLVAWLIVSHHRLPLPKSENCRDYLSEHAKSLDALLARVSQQWSYENRYDEAEYQQRVDDCFVFPKGLLSQSQPWMRQVKKWSKRLLDHQQTAEKIIEDGSYRVVISHARLCLMLGDHLFSSEKEKNLTWQGALDLHANTYIDPQTQQRSFKQKLDEHLVGVAQKALDAAHLLPAFEQELPSAGNLKRLSQASPKDFKWQDKAVKKMHQWRDANNETKKHGCFVVNLASTGCGKTFANAKVMRALSNDGKSLRCILALGLRTLTLQTGDEYRKRIFGASNREEKQKSKRELAVLIGSRAVMELHRQNIIDQEKNSYESSGSASKELLLEEELDTDFDSDIDCDIPERMLTTILKQDRDKQFLYAPLLTCTIDHLMAATETKRGGRYILPTLRLMSSDLVIDEIDDFTGNDLIAIGRLIHLAGMLGRKVMISSATIPPFLAEGYFKAYRDGWQLYCKTRDASQTIACIWIDEFATKVTSNNGAKPCVAVGQYREEHKAFIDKRIVELKKQPAKRKADISDCDTIIEKYKNKSHQSIEAQESKRSAYFKRVAESVMDKHKHQHLKDIDTGLKVSFGVIRVANIQPCVNLTQYLFTYSWPNNIEVRIMAYHSQQVLLMRSEQEKHLDEVLKRKDKKEKTEHTLYHPIVRTHLQNIKQNNSTAKHVIFIVVATPVEEVGRDHDFDWAVIEPSSYRSFIQLAGRVKRHREGETTEPNIALMQYNLKGLIHHDKPETPVFIRPGFEDVCPLVSHDLSALVDTEEIAKTLDAIPRIRQPQGLSAESIRTMQSAQSLVELEHAATWYWLANYRTEGKGAQVAPDTLQGWLNHHWFLSALPQELAPFRKSEPRLKVFLTFDEDQQTSVFCEKDEQGEIIDRETSLNIQRFELSEAAKKRLWLVRDFNKCCDELANKHRQTQRRISLRYGELNFPWQATKHYGYNDQLGLVKV